MKRKHQIEYVKPVDYQTEGHYSFKDYLEKSNYRWANYGYQKFDEQSNSWKTFFSTNKNISFKINIHLGERERFDPFNEYPNLPKTYQAFDETIVYLNSTIFLKNFKSHELIEIIAILTKDLPFVEFQYYSAGDNYGYEEIKIVKYNKKILKYFYVIIDNELYTLFDYYIKYKKDKTESEITSIVKEYLDELDYKIRLEDEYEEKNNPDFINYPEKYSIEDSYHDGGGGDEWSDPTEFW